MVEIATILLIIWALGIPVFMYSFSVFMKNDPDVADMLRMSAEMNPIGIVLLSIVIVFWPVTLVMRMIKR